VRGRELYLFAWSEELVRLSASPEFPEDERSHIVAKMNKAPRWGARKT
jgi:hypothetical protein